MSSHEKPWRHWRDWSKNFALDHVDLGLALLITLIGLVLFRFTGIGERDSRAGFAFLQNIEQSSSTCALKRAASARTTTASLS